MGDSVLVNSSESFILVTEIMVSAKLGQVNTSIHLIRKSQTVSLFWWIIENLLIDQTE